MSAAFVRNHTGGQDKVSTNATIVNTLDALVAAGNMLVIGTGVDNLASPGGPTVSSISVPSGETAAWTQVERQAEIVGAGAGSVATEMWAVVTTIDWPATFTPVVTFSNTRTAKASAIKEFSGLTKTLRGTAGKNVSATGTPSATVTGVLNGDVVVGVVGSESAIAPASDTDTTAGSWSSIFTKATSGGLDGSNIVVGLQHKIVTADSDQTFNPVAQNNDAGAIVAAFQPYVAPTGQAIKNVVRSGAKKTVTSSTLIRSAAKKAITASVIRSGSKKTIV
jgi:hypothetical protein